MTDKLNSNWNMFLLSDDRIIKKVDRTGRVVKYYFATAASKQRLVDVSNKYKNKGELSISLVLSPYPHVLYTCISRNFKTVQS